MEGYDQKTNTFRSRRPRIPRALTPPEIQAAFKLPPMKDVWSIPGDDGAQTAHVERLKAVLGSADITASGAFNSGDIEAVHDFDRAVQKAVSENRVNFECFSMGKQSLKSMRFSEAL